MSPVQAELAHLVEENSRLVREVIECPELPRFRNDMILVTRNCYIAALKLGEEEAAEKFRMNLKLLGDEQ